MLPALRTLVVTSGDLVQLLIRAALFLVCLYVFLAGVTMIQDSFWVLSGKRTQLRPEGQDRVLFGSDPNPVAGLMLGIIGTVVVQSSSISTSIVVTLVSIGELEVVHAIPIVMGCNIGTTITNILVSLSTSQSAKELELSYAAAMVHDIFNVLTMALLLPTEMCTGFLRLSSQGFSYLIAHGRGGVDINTQPSLPRRLSGLLIKPNLFLISVLREFTEDPDETDRIVIVSDAVRKGCTVKTEQPVEPPSKVQDVGIETATEGYVDRLHFEEHAWISSRRVDEGCQVRAYCLSRDIHKKWREAMMDVPGWRASEFNCRNALEDHRVCEGNAVCWFRADVFWRDHLRKGRLVKGGYLQGMMNDGEAGVLGVLIALALMLVGFFAMVRVCQGVFAGGTRAWVAWASRVNEYTAMVAAMTATLIVQSSTLVISRLTPLAGTGALPLDKLLPMALGANVGTCSTAIVAAMTDLKTSSLAIAFCHLLFNVYGVVLWFVQPSMRAVLLGIPKLLGMYAYYHRWVPIAYVLTTFVVAPLIILCMALVLSVPWAISLGVVGVVAIGLFAVWWNCLGGCYRFISQDLRDLRELDEAMCAQVSEVELPHAEGAQ